MESVNQGSTTCRFIRVGVLGSMFGAIGCTGLTVAPGQQPLRLGLGFRVFLYGLGFRHVSRV